MEKMTSRGGHFPQARCAGGEEDHHALVKAEVERNSLLKIQGGELKHMEAHWGIQFKTQLSQRYKLFLWSLTIKNFST